MKFYQTANGNYINLGAVAIIKIECSYEEDEDLRWRIIAYMDYKDIGSEDRIIISKYDSKEKAQKIMDKIVEELK